MARIDQLIADFMKGAQQAGAQVETQAQGHEEKLASDQAYVAGMKAAAARFKVSSLLGPLGFVGGTLLANKIPGAGKALHTAASMGAGMAGQAAGDHISNKLSPPR